LLAENLDGGFPALVRV